MQMSAGSMSKCKLYPARWGSVLCPSADSGSSKMSAWLQLADLLRSTGQCWLTGNKRISKVKIWCQEEMLIKQKPIQQGYFFVRGVDKGDRWLYNYEMKARFLKKLGTRMLLLQYLIHGSIPQSTQETSGKWSLVGIHLL